MKEKLQELLIKQANLASERAEKAKTSSEFLDYIRSLEIIYKQLVAEVEFRECSLNREVIKAENLNDILKVMKSNVCG